MAYVLANERLIGRKKGKNWAWRFITAGIKRTKMDDQLTDIINSIVGRIRHNCCIRLYFYRRIQIFLSAF